MQVYTMGFTKKTAEQFFELIKKYKIKILIDIRLNNQSQLAGFTKGRDLPYLLKQICNCDYSHVDIFAPSKDLLGYYKEGKITWEDYNVRYNKLFEERHMDTYFLNHFGKRKKVLLLCSEPTAEQCHRRLLAENLQKKLANIEIVHI